MDKAPEPQAASGDSPYLRLPWQIVAGGLLLLLVVALAGGLLANRYLQPQTTVLPTATEVPVVSAAVTSTPQPVVGPTVGPTAAPTPIAIAVPLASPTAAGATLTPVAIAVGTPTASPSATVEPTLAAEVGRAYEVFWRVRAQALLQL